MRPLLIVFFFLLSEISIFGQAKNEFLKQEKAICNSYTAFRLRGEIDHLQDLYDIQDTAQTKEIQNQIDSYQAFIKANDTVDYESSLLNLLYNPRTINYPFDSLCISSSEWYFNKFRVFTWSLEETYGSAGPETRSIIQYKTSNGKAWAESIDGNVGVMNKILCEGGFLALCSSHKKLNTTRLRTTLFILKFTNEELGGESGVFDGLGSITYDHQGEEISYEPETKILSIYADLAYADAEDIPEELKRFVDNNELRIKMKLEGQKFVVEK